MKKQSEGMGVVGWQVAFFVLLIIAMLFGAYENAKGYEAGFKVGVQRAAVFDFELKYWTNCIIPQKIVYKIEEELNQGCSYRGGVFERVSYEQQPTVCRMIVTCRENSSVKPSPSPTPTPLISQCNFSRGDALFFQVIINPRLAGNSTLTKINTYYSDGSSSSLDVRYNDTVAK